MDNKCETVGKYLMPMFRSMVAKELVVTHKLTQMQASEILGTTQAAVSQYLSSKRAVGGSEKFFDVLPKLKMMANRTADQLITKQITWKDVARDFCNICSSLIEFDANIDDYSI
jgi:predicted transcriptional regulator